MCMIRWKKSNLFANLGIEGGTRTLRHHPVSVEGVRERCYDTESIILRKFTPWI